MTFRTTVGIAALSLMLTACSGAPSRDNVATALQEQIRTQLSAMRMLGVDLADQTMLASLDSIEVTDLDCVKAGDKPGFYCAYSWVARADGPDAVVNHAEDRFVHIDGAWRIAG